MGERNCVYGKQIKCTRGKGYLHTTMHTSHTARYKQHTPAPRNKAFERNANEWQKNIYTTHTQKTQVTIRGPGYCVKVAPGKAKYTTLLKDNPE